MTFNQQERDATESDTQRIGIFFRMATDPVIRLWLGIGDIKPGANALDASDEVYQGLGQLIDVPPVQQLINGTADRITFNLSGVSADVLAMAANEANDIKGKAVSLGIALFGGTWQQLAAPHWIFHGYADYVTLQQNGTDKGIVRVLELSVGSLFVSRRRRELSYLVDHDQQARHPGDLICERTVRYSQEVNKAWPTF